MSISNGNTETALSLADADTWTGDWEEVRVRSSISVIVFFDKASCIVTAQFSPEKSGDHIQSKVLLPTGINISATGASYLLSPVSRYFRLTVENDSGDNGILDVQTIYDNHTRINLQTVKSGTAVVDNETDVLNVQLASTAANSEVTVVGAAADGANVSGNPVLIAGSDGTNAQTISTDANGRLQVDVVSGGGGNDSVIVDDAEFTPAATSVTMMGGFCDETSTDNVNEGDGGALRMTTSRELYVTGPGIAGTAATGVVTVQGIPNMTALNISGEIPEAAAASGTNPVLVAGRYDTDVRTLTDGQMGAIALDDDGSVRISDGGNSITVEGTVTATLSATDNAVLDQIETNTSYGDKTGGGSESGALRVTIADNSTGLISVTNTGTFSTQVDGDALTALQLIDDTVATLGTDTYTENTTKGNIIGAVRNDTLAALADANNNIAPLQVNANGALYVMATGDDSGTTRNVTVDANGRLQVDVVSGGGGVTPIGSTGNANPADAANNPTPTANFAGAEVDCQNVSKISAYGGVNQGCTITLEQSMDGSSNNYYPTGISNPAIVSGAIISTTSLSGGTGYSAGDKGFFSGGTGFSAEYEIDTVSGGVIITFTVTNAGSGYNVNDTLTFDGGNYDATVDVLEIVGGNFYLSLPEATSRYYRLVYSASGTTVTNATITGK